MSHLPPEDQPDTVDIGPVRGIPIHYEDDPRLEEERALWSSARKKALAMLSSDELLAGLEDPDWRVRVEVTVRLAVRGEDDPRTPRALGRTLAHDPAWQVRERAAMEVGRFKRAQVVRALRDALSDPNEEVRESAALTLSFIEQDLR